MFCLRCGTKVEENTEFCPHCGANIKEELSRYNYATTDEKKPKESPTHEEQYNYSLKYSYAKDSEDLKRLLHINDKFLSSISPKEEEYLKAYVGVNYEKIKSNSFSFPTFLFGPFYLFYRKEYLLGIIDAIICSVFILQPEYYFLIGLIFGILFRIVYINKARRKIGNILIKYDNLSHDEKIEKCRKKGGTNIILPIILFIIMIFVLCIQIVKDETTNNLVENKPLTEDKTFKEKNLSYTIPKNFYLGYDGSTTNSAYKNYYSTDNYCHILVTTSYNATYYDDEFDYINNLVLYNEKDKSNIPITEININNETWQQVKITGSYEISNSYILKKKNDYYEIETSSNPENQEICKADFEKVINSLTYNK